jgi:hypothetical protein
MPLGLIPDTLQSCGQERPATLAAVITPDGLTETPETAPLQAWPAEAAEASAQAASAHEATKRRRLDLRLFMRLLP